MLNCSSRPIENRSIQHLNDADGSALLTIDTAGVQLQPAGVERRNDLWRLVPPVVPVPVAGAVPVPPPPPPLPRHVLTYQGADRFLRPLLLAVLQNPPAGSGSGVWVKWTPLAVYLPLQAISEI